MSGDRADAATALLTSCFASIQVNPYSWNNNATVVWIDQPVGTGFSYADKDVFERNEDEVAADVFLFIQGFYAKYPQYKPLPLYITGACQTCWSPISSSRCNAQGKCVSTRCCTAR